MSLFLASARAEEAAVEAAPTWGQELVEKFLETPATTWIAVAVLAALGWQIFSNLYSVYVEHFTPLGNIYGSVYAVSLSMLWLYCCMSILFYGGVLNVLLRENMSKS